MEEAFSVGAIGVAVFAGGESISGGVGESEVRLNIIGEMGHAVKGVEGEDQIMDQGQLDFLAVDAGVGPRDCHLSCQRGAGDSRHGESGI